RRAGEVGGICLRVRRGFLRLAAEPGKDHPPERGVGGPRALPLRLRRARRTQGPAGSTTGGGAQRPAPRGMTGAGMNEAELMPPRRATGRLMARRFRGFLPVVIDCETGGFHAATDALLEVAAVLIEMDPDGTLRRGATHNYHIKPFEGGRIDPASLTITGIDPHHPLR